MTPPSSKGQSPLDMLRPTLWLAAAAFAAGFGGYLAVAIKAAQTTGRL
ncbi:hypothetical protein [Caulobacter segnis]|uniref:Uncharacterized protein n=1 Tax=Caulobacter segnis (strain ATCC 21756 / DSM 7131 / JCM 7823 / NBRC 15250 / LMG 17158 / TK0059) TaxID=509190 RepID=D5VQ00_CAUST|nr:hypothetical protein [Caulobacter segnis]ADG12573.1 hypothetical protein Cseg_4163 [Caulobacter segnis ATCC 21756]